MKGSIINGGPGAAKRRDLDFYPTPANVTVALMDFLKLPKSTILEPACGDGHMSRVFENYGHAVIQGDISKGNDYLLSKYPKVDAIITNPPFNLAENFILKALNEAPTVCMLLKSQFWHAKKKTKYV